jgi:hypothetical protein
MEQLLTLKDTMENIFPHQMGLMLNLLIIKFQPQSNKQIQANHWLNGFWKDGFWK